MAEQQTTTVRSGGVGILGLTFLIFLVLKLTETGAVATWSWWWVTSPLWLPTGVVLSVCAVLLLVAGVADAMGKAGRRNRRKWK